MFFLHYAKKRTHQNQSTTCKSHRHHMVWGLWFAYDKESKYLIHERCGTWRITIIKETNLKAPHNVRIVGYIYLIIEISLTQK